jgi:Sucrase/ferredoxin-like
LPENGCTHCAGCHTGRRPCLASATAGSRGWLLVEHPGPWGEEIDTMPLPAPVAEAVARARRHGVRPQLIRAPRRRRATPPLQVYAGFSGSGGGASWLEGRELEDPGELAGLDLAAVTAGRPPGFGVPVHGPVLLVCTHGRHNACCARLGAPLARFLHERFGDVWETTHVGGDRYAANLVCLPHGLYYGDLDPVRALSAAEEYRHGRVVLESYRGRVGLPEPVQAAEHFVRARSGVLGVDDVTVESMAGLPDGGIAYVRAGRSRYRLQMEERSMGACGPGCGEELRTYIERGLTLLNTTALV